MGNTSQKQNTNFNTTYNMQQHQRKMSQMNHYYHNHNLIVPNNNKFKTNVKQQKHQNIRRKNALYKPSILIVKTQNNKIQIGFEYFSQNGCKFIMYAAVNGIVQDDVTQKTKRIQSQYKFQQQLAPGKKQKVSFIYTDIYILPTITQKQLIFRIQSSQQSSQYQFRKGPSGPSSWTIILQKLQTPTYTYEIQNIYKGGSQQQQDCIVCMSEKSTTIVKPCNHMCLCKECADRVGKATDKCPICRKGIQGLVMVKQE